jgi:sensor histidine kinase YesM
MVKRKFSSERLYKVTKTLVIVISILVGLIAIYSLYEMTHDVYTDGSGLLKRRHTWENQRNLGIAFLGFVEFFRGCYEKEGENKTANSL